MDLDCIKIRVLLVGESGVGKTSIMKVYCDEKFNYAHMSTIGIDFSTKIVERAGNKYSLQIWDTAGQERFRSITHAYYRGAQCIMYIFDLNEHSSFYRVKDMIEMTKNYTTDPHIKILVGNKVDLVSILSTPHDKEYQEYARNINIPYFEVSSKNNQNIEEIFIEATKAPVRQETLTVKLTDYYESEPEKCSC